MKKISLIIPVYNTEAYLDQALRSAAGQTWENMEIICVDDGSTDGSGRILEAFKAADSRFRVIRQDNRGESAARNRGLREATGDFIGFMDCDDWLDRAMYERLAEAMERTGADLGLSGGWYREEEGRTEAVGNRRELPSPVFGRQELLRYLYERDQYRGFAYMWNKLYRRELLFEGGRPRSLFDETLKLGGDILYLGEAALRVRRAVWVRDIFYHYRQRGDSGCHRLTAEKRRDWLRAYELLLPKLEAQGTDRATVDFVKRFMGYHASNWAEAALREGDGEALLEFQAVMRRYQGEYERLNRGRADWIARFQRLLETDKMEDENR